MYNRKSPKTIIKRSGSVTANDISNASDDLFASEFKSSKIVKLQDVISTQRLPQTNEVYFSQNADIHQDVDVN